MNMNSILMAIAALVTIVSSITAGITWIAAAKLAPLEKALSGQISSLEIVIGNNTKALERIETVTTKHAELLDDHADRLVRIETEHRLRYCDSHRSQI